MPSLPQARGECSAVLLHHLREEVHELPPAAECDVTDPLADDDLHLALYMAYELHYRGLPGVDDAWEWEPSLLALRRALEARFEAGLREAVGDPRETVAPEDADLAIRSI